MYSTLETSTQARRVIRLSALEQHVHTEPRTCTNVSHTRESGKASTYAERDVYECTEERRA